VAPVHVEAAGAGVEFDPGAGVGAGVDDGAVVDFVGLAFEEVAAGEVPKAVDGGMAGGANEPGGGLGFGAAEALVDAVSSWRRRSSGKSRVPSLRMSTSTPVRRRKSEPSLARESLMVWISLSWLRRRASSRPLAWKEALEWSVMAQ